MNYIYILSTLILIISFLLIKKSKHSLNILTWLFISIIIFMSYNSTLIFILSFFNLKASLILKILINILISLIFISKIKLKRQKYFFEIKDFFFICMLFCLMFIIFFLRFGIKFNINFEINDAAVHYRLGKTYYLTKKIEKDAKLFFACTNLGTFFEMFDVFVTKYTLYKLFMIFETLSLYLGGALFYFLIKKDFKNKKQYLFTCILTILYLFGYPLFNFLYGFHYWGLSILVIETIIILLKELIYYKIKNKYLYFCLFILLISVFSSYYLLIPPIYGGIAIYLIFLLINKKISWKLFIIYSIILIITFTMGLFHYVVKDLFKAGIESQTYIFGLEGYNYVNIISNFILFLPLIITNIYRKIKTKKITIEIPIFILTIIYAIILYIGCVKEIVSVYYFGKIYNLLWLLYFSVLSYSIYEKHSQETYTYIIFYIILIIGSFYKIDSYVLPYENATSKQETIKSLTDIYNTNITLFKHKYKYIDNDINKFLVSIKENEKEYQNENGEIPFLATYFQKLWISTVYDIKVELDGEGDELKRTELFHESVNNLKNKENLEYFIWIIYENLDEFYEIEGFKKIKKENGCAIMKKDNQNIDK